MQRRKNDNFVQNLSSGEESDGSDSNVWTSGKFEPASSSSDENLPLSTLVSEKSQRRDRILWKTKDNQLDYPEYKSYQDIQASERTPF